MTKIDEQNQNQNLDGISLFDLGEIIANADYKLGVVVGYEEVANDLLKQAGKAFQEIRDEQAKSLREQSKAYSVKAEKLRKDYETTLKLQKQTALVELKKRDKQ